MKTEDTHLRKRTDNTVFAQDTLRQWNKVLSLRPVLQKRNDENRSFAKKSVMATSFANKITVDETSLCNVSSRTAGSYM